MIIKIDKQSGFATSQAILLVIAAIVIVAIGAFVVANQKSGDSKSSDLSGSISCKISNNPEQVTSSTKSFRVIYSVTNNSNQQIESKWYLTDINTSPQEGDITSSLAPGSTKVISVDYSGTPTKAFSAAIGAYANGGTVPGSASDTCKKIWQI